jgi:hypothetical protein
MKTKILLSFTVAILSLSSVLALAPKETAQYFNGPTISSITNTSATISLSEKVLHDIPPDEKSQIYFEYIETHQMCIMIYPTPAECLPKKTPLGQTSVTISNLKSNTSYTVKYKKDNTIRCITTPCPGNEFESLSVEFVTKGNSPTIFSRNLFLGMYGKDVLALQQVLIEQGYLSSNATGYFGTMTREAVKKYQSMHNIIPTGIVGKMTRGSLNPAKGEYFEGKISAFSTECFVDGECSVTVGGKKVVTTRGWARDPVGSLKGVESIGDIEKNIGKTGKVYAAKTQDGYTLYGNKEFYLEVVQ